MHNGHSEQNCTVQPCQSAHVKTENAHLLHISHAGAPNDNRAHPMASWAVNGYPIAISLPSIHQLDLRPVSPVLPDTRRSSTASYESPTTQFCPSPPGSSPHDSYVSQVRANQMPIHDRDNSLLSSACSSPSPRSATNETGEAGKLHAKQQAQVIVPGGEAGASSDGELDREARLNKKLNAISHKYKQREIQKALKAEREKSARFDQNIALGSLQNSVLAIHHEMPTVARRGPGKSGLTLLKSNNLHGKVKQTEHRQNALEYNKLHVAEVAKAVIEDDTELFALFLEYLRIGAPSPAGAYGLFEAAVRNRGCVSLDLSQLTNGISNLSIAAVRAKL